MFLRAVSVRKLLGSLTLEDDMGRKIDDSSDEAHLPAELEGYVKLYAHKVSLPLRQIKDGA